MELSSRQLDAEIELITKVIKKGWTLHDMLNARIAHLNLKIEHDHEEANIINKYNLPGE